MNTITIKFYKKIIVTKELELLFLLYPKWGHEFKLRNNIK